MKPEKKPYAPPNLTIYGDVEVITQQLTSGGHLDLLFPAGTPTSNLSFS